MAFVNIVHLSDLHFCQENEKEIGRIIDKLQEDLNRNLLKNENNINLVVFSGDLVKKGNEKKDFMNAYNKCLKPVLATLNLNNDNLFLTPGNHDIQKEFVEEYLEVGLIEYLKEPDNTNTLIDNINKNRSVFKRLTNFDRFKKKLKNSNTINQNILYSTHKIECFGQTFGIACLNSSWRATGKDKNYDHGKLFIGERQIDNAIKDFDNIDIKIGVFHHLLSWLSKEDYKFVKRRLINDFDLLLIGHNHDAEPEMIRNQIGSIIISNCGCLYKNRGFPISYTIITIDVETKIVKLRYRSYADKRERFITATELSENGEEEFAIKNKKKDEHVPVSIIKDKFLSNLKSISSQSLLSCINLAKTPKDTFDIFVEPVLCTKPEYLRISEILKKDDTKDSKEKLEISELIKLRDNFFIIGGRESGKTTLLHYIGIKMIENGDSPEVLYPLYFRYKDIPKGKPVESIKRCIMLYNYEEDLLSDISLDKFLEDGRFIILIDDVDFACKDKINRIKEFIKQFPKNRYIFTLFEDVNSLLNNNQLPSIGIEYKTLYILLFDRHRIRRLISNWFQYSANVTDKLLNEIEAHINNLGIPKNPIMIILLLSVYEHKGVLSCSNRATLIETFIEVILDKHKQIIEQDLLPGFDYGDKEHFLIYIADEMLTSNKYYFNNITDYEKQILDYLSLRNLTRISCRSISEYFHKKGILVFLPNGKIEFQYKCFREYFFAKKIMGDKALFENILSDNKMLTQFKNEIDLLTGIRRNCDEIITLLDEKIRLLYESICIEGEDNFMQYSSEFTCFLPCDRSTSFLELADSLSDKEKDIFLEPSINLREEDKQELIRIIHLKDKRRIVNFIKHKYGMEIDNNNLESIIENIDEKFDEDILSFLEKMLSVNFKLKRAIEDTSNCKNHDRAMEYQGLLSLYSKAIKNSDHILVPGFKYNHLEKCLKYWQDYHKILYIETISLLKKIEYEELVSEDELKQIIKLHIPLYIQLMIFYDLGSEKLYQEILDGIEKNKDDIFLSFQYSCLYADLRLKDYPKKFKIFIKENNRFLLECLLLKLHFYYFTRFLEPAEKSQLENIIADIEMRNSKGYTTNRKGWSKNIYKNKIINIMNNKYTSTQKQLR